MNVTVGHQTSRRKQYKEQQFPTVHNTGSTTPRLKYYGELQLPDVKRYEERRLAAVNVKHYRA
jgi:hypothetical protein